MSIEPFPVQASVFIYLLAFTTPVAMAIAGWQTVRCLRFSALARRRWKEIGQLKHYRQTAENQALELRDLKEKFEQISNEKQQFQMTAAQDSVRLEEKERALVELKHRMETEFKVLSAKLLETSHASFLARANETFERHQQNAAADVESRRKALDSMVQPMAETLERYEKSLVALRQEQATARADLLGRMGELAASTNQVRDEAQKLRSALGSSTRAAGRWGEEQLRNVVEAAGMSAHVDYTEQSAIGMTHTDTPKDNPRDRLIPDMIVNLPGGRKMAVDAKVSIGAFLEASEAANPDDVALHLSRHGEDLWTHVKLLASKDYAASLRDSLDMVIMFVPGENYFAAALEARPALFQDAFERKVMIATPMTLVAMLKAASFHWRQEKAAEHATIVAGHAKGLYDSLRTMSQNLIELGRALDRSVQKYNSALAGFDKRVMVRAKRFAELELPGITNNLPELTQVETSLVALEVAGQYTVDKLNEGPRDADVAGVISDKNTEPDDQSVA
ncbi:MAG: DNA recombination protein RmuC [Pseudomonadota bacterium]